VCFSNNDVALFFSQKHSVVTWLLLVSLTHSLACSLTNTSFLSSIRDFCVKIKWHRGEISKIAQSLTHSWSWQLGCCERENDREVSKRARIGENGGVSHCFNHRLMRWAHSILMLNQYHLTLPSTFTFTFLHLPSPLKFLRLLSLELGGGSNVRVDTRTNVRVHVGLNVRVENGRIDLSKNGGEWNQCLLVGKPLLRTSLLHCEQIENHYLATDRFGQLVIVCKINVCYASLMAKCKRTFLVFVFDGLTLIWRSHFNVSKRWSFTLAEKVLGLWWSSVGSTISYIGARAHTHTHTHRQAMKEHRFLSINSLYLSLLSFSVSVSFSRFQQKSLLVIFR
jgi:hypothetical protein